MQTATPTLIERELWLAERRRHWSPSSQAYASMDVLLDRLTDGWNIDPIVGFEAYWFGGGRHVSVYYFELTKDGQGVIMPVLGNPVVRRLVGQRPFRVKLLSFDEARSFEDEVVEA